MLIVYPKLLLLLVLKPYLILKRLWVIISGHAKSRALAKVVEEGVNHMWTVSALQLHPKGTIVCDEASTVELKVGTVNYFKDIESAHLHPSTQLV
jgi:glucosamine-6-phosphate deaminase